MQSGADSTTNAIVRSWVLENGQHLVTALLRCACETMPLNDLRPLVNSLRTLLMAEPYEQLARLWVQNSMSEDPVIGLPFIHLSTSKQH